MDIFHVCEKALEYVNLGLWATLSAFLPVLGQMVRYDVCTCSMYRYVKDTNAVLKHKSYKWYYKYTNWTRSPVTFNKMRKEFHIRSSPIFPFSYTSQEIEYVRKVNFSSEKVQAFSTKTLIFQTRPIGFVHRVSSALCIWNSFRHFLCLQHFSQCVAHLQRRGWALDGE